MRPTHGLGPLCMRHCLLAGPRPPHQGPPRPSSVPAGGRAARLACNQGCAPVARTCTCNPLCEPPGAAPAAARPSGARAKPRHRCAATVWRARISLLPAALGVPLVGPLRTAAPLHPLKPPRCTPHSYRSRPSRRGPGAPSVVARRTRPRPARGYALCSMLVPSTPCTPCLQGIQERNLYG